MNEILFSVVYTSYTRVMQIIEGASLWSQITYAALFVCI